MKRSAIQPLPEYFDRYIKMVDDMELEDAFEQSRQQLDQINIKALQAIGKKTYAPGKWTVKDILQHLGDTERVLSYRALRFARNDKTKLHGFDQDPFASNAGSNQRELDDLIEELKVIRQATILLYKNFDEEILLRKGISNHVEISVLALGFTIIGHQMHHLNIIKEKYFPLTLPGADKK